jgi:hypothetical protein
VVLSRPLVETRRRDFAASHHRSSFSPTHLGALPHFLPFACNTYCQFCVLALFKDRTIRSKLISNEVCLPSSLGIPLDGRRQPRVPLGLSFGSILTLSSSPLRPNMSSANRGGPAGAPSAVNRRKRSREPDDDIPSSAAHPPSSRKQINLFTPDTMLTRGFSTRIFTTRLSTR